MRHRLSPTLEDNVLSPYKAALVADIIEGYKIDVGKWIAREIRDRPTNTDTIMAFPYLLI